MTPVLVLIGALSAYRPDTTPGELSCGIRYTWKQHHIAIRQWRQVGCGAIAKVCLPDRCIWTEVRDSGPWGCWKGKRREVRVRCRPGWKRKSVVDLSWALWDALGRPRYLTKVKVEVYR